jgi:hypothetical protein
MLIRTDPFRDLDRLTQQMFGTVARPAAMPMDAFRKGDTFYIKLDLPGTTLDAIDLTVEQNVLTVHADRPGMNGEVELLVGERPAGTFTRQVFLGDTPRRRPHRGGLHRRSAHPGHPGARGSQAAQGRDHQPGHQADRRKLISAAAAGTSRPWRAVRV